jgi:hypothetical protein
MGGHVGVPRVHMTWTRLIVWHALPHAFLSTTTTTDILSSRHYPPNFVSQGLQTLNEVVHRARRAGRFFSVAIVHLIWARRIARLISGRLFVCSRRLTALLPPGSSATRFSRIYPLSSVWLPIYEGGGLPCRKAPQVTPIEAAHEQALDHQSFFSPRRFSLSCGESRTKSGPARGFDARTEAGWWPAH